MSASHNTPGQTPYGYDPARRRSLGGASPPNPYGGKAPHRSAPCSTAKLSFADPATAPSHDPPPPPPSFSRPHMPPPLSPQQQHGHGSQMQRAPFASSTFGGNRELPGLGPAHRPGSSMSISSLIGGGDSTASTQPPPPQSSPRTASANAPPPNSHSMQPPSPRRALMSGSRPEFQPFRRQPSPDRHMYPGNTSRAAEGHVYSAGSPTRTYTHQGSPDQGRQPLPQTSQPYKPMIFQSSRPYASSPSEAHPRDARQLPANMPPRPNSQPTGPQGALDQETRSVYDALGGRRPLYGPPDERRRTLGESHHARPNAADLLRGHPQTSTERDRPVTVQPVSHSAFSPPHDQRTAAGPPPPPHGVWRPSGPEDAPRETTEVRRDEQPVLYRGYGPYPTPPQPPAPYGNHTAEDMVRGRSLDHLNHRVVEQYHTAPTSDPHSNDRQKAEQLSRSLSSGGIAYGSRPMYDPSRRVGDDLHGKPILGLGPDANRRTGRASPLPQAVQGAQAQPLSIGKDPSIKSEFGRMFSGLGSGLGSSTPSRQSPMPQGGPDSGPPGIDLNDLRLQRVNSQNGRKSKRVKDEDNIFDGEMMDGRGTPSLNAVREAKRNKHNHPAHHHHHHAHAHHHHHHHRRPEDEMGGPPQAPSATSIPFNARYPNLPPNGPATQSSHHHHHYHAAPHHHHHAPRAGGPALLPSPKLPPKIHDVQDVLDEAAEHPRTHLGSQLYEATPCLPKPNSSLDDQFSYASIPNALPRFDKNPINCTFTVRVPRYYLKPRQRQQIVLQRHLWGARVYRDDSDPIAAAIHSGWIRGEWDDTVDVSMLDPRITEPNDPSDAEDTLTKPPAAPVNPPADMELQITLLILPRLLEYVGSVEYGISSRKSRNHSGLSFMVHKIRWVEEGVGSRGQERGAAAMKRRLDASTTLLSLLNGGDEGLRPMKGMAKLHA
ncbi:Rxt3-domain-containing protein [Amniculicola lignicola CBS 123094]|uniref:Rxt3-domain-containing protein n=1 Tax=Amniculicola lignicola CBS 123094 TaxID=1392246 RepID=A0A6A5W7F4_9PLEO|nr:Rxt3-domain-containing protein [Amniculicola lignicola CBS 123094]